MKEPYVMVASSKTPIEQLRESGGKGAVGKVEVKGFEPLSPPGKGINWHCEYVICYQFQHVGYIITKLLLS